jgi:hypothetical protein
MIHSESLQMNRYVCMICNMIQIAPYFYPYFELIGAYLTQVYKLKMTRNT